MKLYDHDTARVEPRTCHCLILADGPTLQVNICRCVDTIRSEDPDIVICRINEGGSLTGSPPFGYSWGCRQSKIVEWAINHEDHSPELVILAMHAAQWKLTEDEIEGWRTDDDETETDGE